MMSFRKVETEQRVCDWCGKPMDEPVKDVIVLLDSPGTDLKAGIVVRVEAEKHSVDIHERCQHEAIAAAARQVGTRKPRGRAAQRAGSAESGTDYPCFVCGRERVVFEGSACAICRAPEPEPPSPCEADSCPVHHGGTGPYCPYSGPTTPVAMPNPPVLAVTTSDERAQFESAPKRLHCRIIRPAGRYKGVYPFTDDGKGTVGVEIDGMACGIPRQDIEVVEG